MKRKVCSKCKKKLLINKFCTDRKNKDGKQSNCKKCKSKQLSEYYKKNPDKKMKRTKKQGMERYEKNKINMNFSRRMRNALKGLKNYMPWEKLVNYTLIDLKLHLEKRFTDNMTWDNYDKWNIDHIKPICKFNITNIKSKEFKLCWALENLQPLWKTTRVINNIEYQGNTNKGIK